MQEGELCPPSLPLTRSHGPRATPAPVYEPHPLPCQPSHPLTPTLQARLVPDNTTSATDHRSVWKPKLSLWPRSSLSPPSAKSRTFFIVHSLCFQFWLLIWMQRPPPKRKKKAGQGLPAHQTQQTDISFSSFAMCPLLNLGFDLKQKGINQRRRTAKVDE